MLYYSKFIRNAVNTPRKTPTLIPWYACAAARGVEPQAPASCSCGYVARAPRAWPVSGDVHRPWLPIHRLHRRCSAQTTFRVRCVIDPPGRRVRRQRMASRRLSVLCQSHARPFGPRPPLCNCGLGVGCVWGGCGSKSVKRGLLRHDVIRRFTMRQSFTTPVTTRRRSLCVVKL